MEKLTSMASKAINNYFTTLFKLGVTKNSSRDEILILTFLEELLSTDINFFIDEKDYISIMNATSCLSGKTCAIPFMSYESEDTLMHETDADNLFRRTEDNILRFTESPNIRIIE